MPFLFATQDLFRRPLKMLWVLTLIGFVSLLCSGLGFWRVTALSTAMQGREDKALALVVNLKESVSSYSKLTYDFLLQQDFNRMLLKEKQGDQIRDAISRDVTALGLISTEETAPAIDNVRNTTNNFLTLTDKALETAMEDGTPDKARGILQDEVEPALRAAQEASNTLIGLRQKVAVVDANYVRQQAIIFGLLLFGLATLAMALVLHLRARLLEEPVKASGEQMVTAVLLPPEEPMALPAPATTSIILPPAPPPADAEAARRLEARSLATLALINRVM